MLFFERERPREGIHGGGAKKDRDNSKQAVGSGLSAHSPIWGLQPMNLDIMTLAKVRRLTGWATQACPREILEKKIHYFSIVINKIFLGKTEIMF